MKVTKLYTKKEYTCKKCEGQVYYGQITDDTGKTKGNTEVLSEFLVEANNFYQRASPTASKFCGSGATVKDVHITLMGMMHDYFAYKIAHIK